MGSVAGLVACAAVIGHLEHRPLLWGRIAVLLAGTYAAGAVLGAWPWQAGRPLIDLIIRELGG